MGRRSGKARRPLMPVGLAKIILEEMEGKDHIVEIIISYSISKDTWILDIHGIGGDC